MDKDLNAPLSRAYHKYFAIAFITATLCACSDNNMADLHEWVDNVKKRQKGSVEPLPEIKTVEPFIFKPEDIRDPFMQNDRSEIAEESKGDNGIRPDTARARRVGVLRTRHPAHGGNDQPARPFMGIGQGK